MSGCSSVAEVWVPVPRRTIHRVSRQNQLCLGVSCLSSQVDALPITKSGKRDIQAIEHLGHGQKWARFAQCCLASAFAVGYTECEFGVVPKAACGWLGQDREGAAFAISEGSSTCIVSIAYLYHEVIEYNSEEEQLVAAAFNEACWTIFFVCWDMWTSLWRFGCGLGHSVTLCQVLGRQVAREMPLLGGACAWHIVTHDDTMRRCDDATIASRHSFLTRLEAIPCPPWGELWPSRAFGHCLGVWRLKTSRLCWGPVGFFARIAKLLGISPVELFKYPTIASLAKFVESMKVWNLEADSVFDPFEKWIYELCFWTGHEACKKCFCGEPTANATTFEWCLVTIYSADFIQSFYFTCIECAGSIGVTRFCSILNVSMSGPLAVVGLACRLPHADSVEHFWESLKAWAKPSID